MKINWQTELPHWILLVGMVLASAILWSSAPEEIPVHWNAAGEVDRYGGKIEGLLAVPAMAIFLYLLMLFLPKLDPNSANYKKFEGPYNLIRLSTLVVLAIVDAVILFSAFGYQVNVGLIVPLAVGGLFFVIGNVMGKIRPNLFVGIRTPWTLASKRSWVKTHRVGGWVFMGMGIVLMLTSLLPSTLIVWILLSTIFGSVIFLFAYSYFVYAADTDRVSVFETKPAEELEESKPTS